METGGQEEVSVAQRLHSTIDQYRAWVVNHLGATTSDDADLLRQVMAEMNWHPDEWEHGFLQSITVAIAAKRPISPKQVGVLEGMRRKAGENLDPVSPTAPRKQRRATQCEISGDAVKALPLLARSTNTRIFVSKAVFRSLREGFQTVVVGVETRKITGKHVGTDKYEVWTESL